MVVTVITKFKKQVKLNLFINSKCIEIKCKAKEHYKSA